MNPQKKANETTFDSLDKRMKRELAAHNQWVTELEKQRNGTAKPTIKSPKAAKKPLK
ncbi:MAG: hypothetical protein FWC50_03100 [Planctomycetaceae bacterium]|nr:hypothetical protein [Planctomycetaceae bacterium]